MHKREFTASVINEAELDIELSKAVDAWWYRDAMSNKFRMTTKGYNVFKDLVPSVKYSFIGILSGMFYIQLGRMNAPYFLRRNGAGVDVYIFSTKVATIISLYGDLQKYLNTLK